MARDGFERPDVLVLGGGGVLGEAWMSGLLAGVQSAAGFDPRESRAFVGTSAGSIVASYLAAGESPRSPKAAEDWRASPGPSGGTPPRPQLLRRIARGALEAAAPLAPLALRVAAPGGAVARAAALSRGPRGRMRLDDLGRRVEELAPRFDGRLLVSAVELGRGRRVMFGSPRAPEARVSQAVLASCAIPGVFEPVEIGGREYVDGGVWSPTNLDVAPVEAGMRVLCLAPTGSLRGAAGSPLGMLLAAARSVTLVEAAALRRRGVEVRVVAPDREAAGAMGSNLMDRALADVALREGYRQGHVLAA